jgi:hypothetical protein
MRVLLSRVSKLKKLHEDKLQSKVNIKNLVMKKGFGESLEKYKKIV